MSQLPALPLTTFLRDRSRSMGLKLVVVSFLALLMSIPAFFVINIVQERANRARDVVEEISKHVGGQQTFLGPALAIPYTVPPPSRYSAGASGYYIVFPVQGDADVKLHAEQRRRSLFTVPVYQADLNFNAAFDLAGVPAAAPVGASLDWSRARIVIGVSNAHGALADGVLTINGKSFTFAPADDVSDSGAAQRLPLTWLGVNAKEIAQPNAVFHATAALRFSGAQRLAVLAYGKTSHLTVEGDWPSPGFDGTFLPVKRTVSPQSFNAEWMVPFIARGVRAEGTNVAVSNLDSASLGVSLIEVADPYQSINRSLKYLPLFVGLVFLSYFLFEVTAHRRVHPAQYMLVGLAQLIFYLLLLSMAERVGFDWSFLIGGGATVLLLAINAKWIFHSLIQGMRALVAFTLLYGFIYLLLRLEDNALLVGAVASFLAIAAVMYFTRKIDWYSSITSGEQQMSEQNAT